MAKNKVTLHDNLFDVEQDDDVDNEWRNMPEFNQPDNGAFRQIIISFDDQDGVDAFAKLIDQHLTSKTKSLWFPPREKNNVVDKFFYDVRDEGKDGTA